MATIRAFKSLDLVDPDAIDGSVLEATSNDIVISDGLTTDEYEGTNFRFSGSSVIGGTITGITEDDNGIIRFEADGLSLSAADAFYAIDRNDLPTLFANALRGDDSIFGSDFDDDLHGYGGNDDILGKGGNDIIFGGAGDDVINGGTGANKIDGGSGFDVAVYDGDLRDHTIAFSGTAILVDSSFVSDDLTGIERLGFDDAMIAFDAIAAFGYRLYQAAFDRTPDIGGLSYWVDRLDHGLSLETMAANFIGSAEFRGLYGSNPSDADFVDLLYENVLHRSADNAGYDYWLDEFDDGLQRSQMLSLFADSNENRANVANEIAGGIELDYGIFA